MTPKKLFFVLAGLIAAAISVLLIFSPRRPGARQIPSLLSRSLRCDAAAIESAWKTIAARKELASFYIRDRVNRDFPLHAPHCRVKYRDVSHQALLAPANSRIEFDLKVAKGDRLSFSLFNLKPGSLVFQVKALVAGKEKLL
ncbi:MAG TPA: hypothetical protein VLQ89_02270, partial [Candidatus Binatia bacterium]|nr:hypothetical protein [Candidatus Binatia bacterium]